MGKVLVVTSGKGGTGKSTFSVGLGAALCKREKKVLLVDMDQGLRCLDSMLGLSEELAFDIGDVLAKRADVSEAIRQAEGVKGLFLLSGTQSHGGIRDAKPFKALVAELAGMYDYVILDSPAGIGKGFDIAVSAAQWGIVVSCSDLVSIRDAGIIGRLLLDAGLEVRRIVINRIKVGLIRGGILPNIDGMIDRSGLQLLGVVPEDETLLISSSTGVLPQKGKAVAAFGRIAARLEGKTIPLPKFIKKF